MLPHSPFPLLLHSPLTVIQAGVESIGGKQLFVRAALDNLAITHDKDAVRVTDGAQTMRDHKARATILEVASSSKRIAGLVSITRAMHKSCF